MIYLSLFLSFLKIGAFTFGGGYSMISLIRETVLANGWLTEEEIMNFIAVSESTPGPVAINMATFIGSSQGGILGSVCATLGVVLPSFIIILLIVMVMKNLMKYKGVQAFLSGVRPCVVALIIGTSVVLAKSTFFPSDSGSAVFNWRGAVILAAVAAAAFVYKKVKKKKISPIILILLSAVLGAVMF